MSDTNWFGNAFAETSSGITVSQYNFLQDATALACIQILSSDVAKLPLIISRRLPNGGKEPAREHPLYKLFKCPNDYMTRYEWIEHLMTNLLIWGNCYSVILREDGVPTALVPVNSGQVTFRESSVDTQYFYYVNTNTLHERAMLRDVPNPVPSDDVLHIKWLSYINSLFGTDRATLMRETVGLSLALEQSAARMIGNGARPSGVIELEGVFQKESLERLVASWHQSQSGVNRNGGTAVLQPGMKYHPISWSSVDQQFIEQREFVIAQVARAFRIPLYKLSLAEAQPGSSTLQLETDYYESTLSAWTDRIVARLHKTFDVDEDEFEISFDYSHALKADYQTQINTYRIGVIGGLMSINEARQALGLPPVADGDVILQATNLAPLGYDPSDDASSAGPGSDRSGKPGSGGDGSGVEE